MAVVAQVETRKESVVAVAKIAIQIVKRRIDIGDGLLLRKRNTRTRTAVIRKTTITRDVLERNDARSTNENEKRNIANALTARTVVVVLRIRTARVQTRRKRRLPTPNCWPNWRLGEKHLKKGKHVGLRNERP